MISDLLNRITEDIKNLLAIPCIDTEYIVYWCRELKLNTYNLIDHD